MTGAWDEEAERKQRGLPTAQEQKLHGLAPKQLPVYQELVRARKAARQAYSREREAMERRGQAVVAAFARAGISASYEWRTSVPVVEMGLEEAERLFRAFQDLAEAYDIAADAGRALATDVARVLARDMPGTDSGKEPS